MIIIEFSIYPLDKGESVSASVASAVDVIDRSGLSYQLGPMGTCIEGEWDEVMATLKDCYEVVKKDSQRVVFSMKGDWRVGSESRLASKVAAVQTKVGRPLLSKAEANG